MKIEHMTFDEKMSVLKNPSCSQVLLTVFSKDVKNYSSSRLRKEVAMHPSTPKEIVNQLLQDEYLWVRQAAAQNSNLKQNEINNILDKMDKKYPSTHTYKIKSSYGYGIVESSGGSVSMDDVIEAIQSGEDDWKSYAYSDFYQWSGAWQVYGPTTIVDTVVFPDGTEEQIDVNGKFNYDQFEIEIGSEGYDEEPFFQVASSSESGSWNYHEFELIGEFNPDCLTAIYDEEAPANEQIIKYYEYSNEKCDDDTDIEIEGEFDESGGKDIDIKFYVNTDDGLQVCDDFYDMTSEMEEKGLDPESEEDIRAYLKKKYNLSLDISFPEPAFDAKTVKEQWKFKTGGYVTSSPTVSDGVIYVGSYDGHLYAVDAKTGKEQWKFKTGKSIYSSPSVSDGVIYVGSYDGHLYAVDAKTGKEQWKFKTGKDVYSSPAVSDGIVYFSSYDSHLYAVDAKTGKEQWKFETGSWIQSSPAVSDGIVYVGSSDNHLYAVDAKTGAEQWKFETGERVNKSPTFSDGVVYFGNIRNHVYALDAKTGAEQWKFETKSYVCSSPTVSDGMVYFGSIDNHLYAIDAKIGKEQWKFDVGGSSSTTSNSSPRVSDGVIYVGSHDNHLYAVDAKTGKVQWKFKTGEKITSSPAVSGSVIYVGSWDSHLYALKMISPDEE